MSKIEIDLPPVLAEFLESQVEAGLYNSVGAAIDDAVRRDYEGLDERVEAIRAALEAGLADIKAGRTSELRIEEFLAEARALSRAD
jgi:putative addiction module CopG family antidote